MATSLWLLIIGALVLIFLVVKFIKKIVWMIISIIFIILLMFASVFGLVYYDFKELSSQEAVTINLVYEDAGSFIFGVSFRMIDGKIKEDDVKKINSKKLKDLKTLNFEKNSSEYLVILPKEVYEKVIEKKSISLNELILDETFKKYDLTLSKKEILEIYNSKDGVDELVNILFDKNQISGFEAQVGKPLVKGKVEDILGKKNLGIKEALFLLSLKEALISKDSALVLIEEYKSSNIVVKPERLTFNLIKWLPSGYLLSLMEDGSSKSNKLAS